MYIARIHLNVQFYSWSIVVILNKIFLIDFSDYKKYVGTYTQLYNLNIYIVKSYLISK